MYPQNKCPDCSQLKAVAAIRCRKCYEVYRQPIKEEKRQKQVNWSVAYGKTDAGKASREKYRISSKGKAKIAAARNKAVIRLSDSYVKRTISILCDLSHHNIPQDMIGAKRAQLKVTRLIRSMNNE